MPFERYEPSGGTKDFIENYWIVASEDGEEDKAERVQKIIPDGFTEIIFHYGDPYCIKWIAGDGIGKKNAWEIQPRQLLAGQIRKYFFLKNTGRSGVIGIKCKPAALTVLFGLEMKQYTDKVVDLYSAVGERLSEIGEIACSGEPNEIKIGLIDGWFRQLCQACTGSSGLSGNDPGIEKAVDLIFQTNGLVSVGELCSRLFITERQLERLFSKYIGLSPKFYARLIRFNYIFSLIQDKKLTWTELASQSGYYDLSHFVKNFQSFTGEDPSGYVFEDENLANFFLLKKKG